MQFLRFGCHWQQLEGRVLPALGHGGSIDSLERSVWPEQAVLCGMGDLLFYLGETGVWKEFRYVKSGNIPEKQGGFYDFKSSMSF